MRRLVLALAIMGGLVPLLCGVAAFGSWSQPGHNLVLANSAEVAIKRHGAARYYITYRLPPRTTFHDLRRWFDQQGWRRASAPRINRFTTRFVRTTMFGVLREVAVVSTDPETRRTATIVFARCIKLDRWTACP